jgi:hypothetical protein
MSASRSKAASVLVPHHVSEVPGEDIRRWRGAVSGRYPVAEVVCHPPEASLLRKQFATILRMMGKSKFSRSPQ